MPSLRNVLDATLGALPSTGPSHDGEADSSFEQADTPGDDVFGQQSERRKRQYFRVKCVGGVAVTREENPDSETAGELQAGEVVEVLCSRNWEAEGEHGSVRASTRLQTKRGWVALFSASGELNLERMDSEVSGARAHAWGDSAADENDDDTLPRARWLGVGAAQGSSGGGGGGDDTSGSERGGGGRHSRTSSVGSDFLEAAAAAEWAEDLAAGETSSMLLGEWDPASAPCYRVPASLLEVTVRARLELKSRRCGLLYAGEVMQITETQAIDKRSRVVRGRFDCGWVTLIDGEGKLVLDWTAEPPTQLLRDKDLQVHPLLLHSP